MSSGPAPHASGGAPGLAANRNFAYYLLASVAGWAAIAIADVVFLFLVYSETGSALAVAYVGLAEALPPIALGIPAGVVADRYDRRRVLLLTSAGQAVAIGLVFLYLRAFGFHLGVILLLLTLLESVTVVFRPSSTALLPGLVGEADLEDANGAVQASTSVSATVGAAASAVVLGVGGIGIALLLDGLLIVAGGLLFAAIVGRYGRRERTPVDPPKEELLGEFSAGIGFLRRQPALAQLTVASIASGFFVEMFSPFLVVYATRVLDAPGASFGFLLAGFSAGFFAGSLLVRRIGVLREFGPVFALALMMSGGLLALLLVAPNFGVAIGALAGVGLLLGLVVTGFAVLVQRLVPGELLGRFLGVDETLTWTVAPLGILSGGLLSQAGGVDLAFSIAIVGLIGTGILALLLPGLRSIRLDPGEPKVPEGARWHPPGI